MFDKNVFKDSFRVWSEQNPDACPEEVLVFCESNIPESHYGKNLWLIEQSLEWFRWRQTQELRSNRTPSEADRANFDDLDS